MTFDLIKFQILKTKSSKLYCLDCVLNSINNLFIELKNFIINSLWDRYDYEMDYEILSIQFRVLFNHYFTFKIHHPIQYLFTIQTND